MKTTNTLNQFLKEFNKESPDIRLLSKMLDESGIDVNGYRNEHGETLLNVAADDKRNYELVKLLLEHGADPEIPLDEENCTVLWNMQYANLNNEDNIDTHTYEESVRITELLLQFGANPASVCDNESLYYYIRYKVFNEPEFEHDYIIIFMTLMIVYGEEKLKEYVNYKKPFNKDIALAYRLYFKDVGDGYHKTGVIYGPSSEIYAEL